MQTLSFESWNSLRYNLGFGAPLLQLRNSLYCHCHYLCFNEPSWYNICSGKRDQLHYTIFLHYTRFREISNCYSLPDLCNYRICFWICSSENWFVNGRYCFSVNKVTCLCLSSWCCFCLVNEVNNCPISVGYSSQTGIDARRGGGYFKRSTAYALAYVISEG